MHSNSIYLLSILMRTIFPTFLTQCQLVWNSLDSKCVTSSTYSSFMNHLIS